MPNRPLEHLLDERDYDIVAGMTLSLKGQGGRYAKRPTEEIFRNSQIFFRAYRDDILRGKTRPLADVIDMVVSKRVVDRFQLREMVRAAGTFKRVVSPMLVRSCPEDRYGLLEALSAVDRTVDYTVGRVAEIFISRLPKSEQKGLTPFNLLGGPTDMDKGTP